MLQGKYIIRAFQEKGRKDNGKAMMAMARWSDVAWCSYAFVVAMGEANVSREVSEADGVFTFLKRSCAR